MSIYEGVIKLLETFGFFDIIAPFFLVWAVVYGILYKTKLIGDLSKDEKARSIASMIAFSVALLTIGSLNVVSLMKNTIPYIILTILIIFTFVILIGILYLGEDGIKLSKNAKIIIGILAGITFILAVIYSLGLLGMVFQWFSEISSGASSGMNEEMSNLIAAVVILAFMVGFVIWMVKPPKQKTQESQQQNNKQ